MSKPEEKSNDGSPRTSNRNVALILIATAVASLVWIAYVNYDVEFWLSKPNEKFATAWARDMIILEKSQKLPKQWNEIREFKIEADNSPIQDWLVGYKPPINLNREGKYRIAIFIVHWIEGSRYGVLINYHLEDIATNNTIWESARTLPLGIVY